MIAALTWAAAQDRIPVHELIRGLTPTDERRIEAAYTEWRRRAAAGEKRPKVDWHSYPVLDIPSEDGAVPAQSVTAVSIPVDPTKIFYATGIGLIALAAFLLLRRKEEDIL